MGQLTSSPFWISLIPAASSFPVFAIGLVAGTLADRLDNRRYLLIMQSLQALVAVALALGCAAGTEPITGPWTSRLSMRARSASCFGCVPGPSITSSISTDRNRTVPC